MGRRARTPWFFENELFKRESYRNTAGPVSKPQERLAELAGVSRVYLGTIERGKTACSIDIVEQLAQALDVAVPELLSPAQRAR